MNPLPPSTNPNDVSSPPSPRGSRKPSIAERIEGKMVAPLRRIPTAGSTSGGNALNEGEVSFTVGSGESVYPSDPKDYEIGNPIGFGSSAAVYIAKCIPLKKNVAIKMIDLDMFERNQIDELRREIQTMSLSRHPNLLTVQGAFVNGSKLYIITPLLSAGSCLDIMKTAYPDGLEEIAIATILKQGLLGLEYLHKNGLIHRDVKAGNLLVDEDGLVQLADFGVSSSLMETGERKGLRKTFVGTPCWMAPEVMEQSGYDYKADIWSFGITALELATGHAPFAQYPPIKVLMLTLQNDPPTLDRDTTKHKYTKLFKDMIDSCLQKDPARRPTAEKLLQHAFFKTARRGPYLVQTILKGLPPINQRQHQRSLLLKTEKEAKGISWDFSSDEKSESGEAKPEKRGASQRKVAFSDFAEDEQINSTSTTQPVQTDTASLLSNSVESSHSLSNVSNLPQQQQTRGSRFTVEEYKESGSNHNSVTGRDSVVSPTSMTSPPGTIHQQQQQYENYQFPPQNQQNPQQQPYPAALQPVTSTSSISSMGSAQNPQATGEIKIKGRFSVLETSSISESGNVADTTSANKPNIQPTKSGPMDGSGSLNERQSRFTVSSESINITPQSQQSTSQLVPQSILTQSHPSQYQIPNNSSSVSLTNMRQIQQPSTTSLNSNPNQQQHALSESAPLPVKGSRFEVSQRDGSVYPVSGGMVNNRNSTVRKSSDENYGTGVPPTNEQLQERLEAIMRQNEQQKQMLNELLYSMGNQNGNAASQSATTIFSQNNLQIYEIEKQLQAVLYENEQLRKENEVLRNEVEYFKGRLPK